MKLSFVIPAYNEAANIGRCLDSIFGELRGKRQAYEIIVEDADVAQRLHRVGRVKFTISLPISASARRLHEEGVLTTGIRYALNYFWVVAFGRPFSRVSRDIRPA